MLPSKYFLKSEPRSPGSLQLVSLNQWSTGTSSTSSQYSSPSAASASPGAVTNPPIGSQSAFVHLFEWPGASISRLRFSPAPWIRENRPDLKLPKYGEINMVHSLQPIFWSTFCWPGFKLKKHSTWGNGLSNPGYWVTRSKKSTFSGMFMYIIHCYSSYDWGNEAHVFVHTFLHQAGIALFAEVLDRHCPRMRRISGPQGGGSLRKGLWTQIWTIWNLCFVLISIGFILFI